MPWPGPRSAVEVEVEVDEAQAHDLGHAHARRVHQPEQQLVAQRRRRTQKALHLVDGQRDRQLVRPPSS